MNEPLEIEHKYLIRMPDRAALAALPGARVYEITQTYLTARAGLTRRVRKKCEGDRVTYIYTEKERRTHLCAVERERTLDLFGYEELLREADPAATPIEKTRIAIPFAAHVLEVDFYPFWQEHAILEVELSSEEETVTLPPFLTVLCEVSEDRRFKNAALAKNAAQRGDLPHLICPKTP